MMATAIQAKTIQNQINPPTVSRMKPSKLNTVILFDFDDTLFPSSKLREILARPNRTNTTNYDHKVANKQPLTKSEEFESKLTTKERVELTKMSFITYNLLSLYIATYSKQNICIVTSSYQDHVKNALSMVYKIGCYSLIYHLLFDNNIPIYHPSDAEFKSIEQKVNTKNIKDPRSHPACLWKYETFKRVFKQKAKISNHLTINTFVIIGDSWFEHIAAKKLNEYIEYFFGNNDRNIFIDRVKLERNPTISTLKREQNVLFQFCQKKYYDNYSLLKQDRFDFDYSKEKNNSSSKFFSNK